MDPLRIAPQLRSAAAATAAAWTSFKASPWAGKARLLCLAGALLWLGVNFLHESLWSYRHWKVDGWRLDVPIQWPTVGQHARTHAALAEELQSCLPEGAKIAIRAPESLGGNRVFLGMWLAYLFPQQNIFYLRKPGVPEFADLYVQYHAEAPIPPVLEGWQELCRARYMVFYERIHSP